MDIYGSFVNDNKKLKITHLFLTGEYLNKPWAICTVEYYTAIQATMFWFMQLCGYILNAFC